MRPRVLAVLAVLGSALVCAAGSGAAESPVLPVAPRQLVLARASFPGFTGAKSELRSTISPSVWAQGILGDPPANGAEEVARLTEEDLLEAVREGLTRHDGFAFSGTLLFTFHASAVREAKFKTKEELSEFGRGATRSKFKALRGAVELQQTQLRRSPYHGLYPVSIVFSMGRCTAAVGVAVRTIKLARTDTIRAAMQLHHQIRQPCQ